MSETPDLSHCDRIQIEDLIVRTVIGIFDRERDRCQEVVINITLWTDITAAARSDDIEQAVDYRSLTKNIIEHV
ncbi:MAG: FolB domain-containing protein, partial [Planctomycetes bacterium]|nr:FolB domain-containing protein [Planctomycetota bacterium]